MATTTSKTTADATTERIHELNDRVFDTTRKAGAAYLDAYEKSMDSLAGYQEKVAKDSGVEWVTTVAGAQARLTREVTKLSVSTGREFLKG